MTYIIKMLTGNVEIAAPGADYDTFCEVLRAVNLYLSRAIAADGEGATKLLECVVNGAKSYEDARDIAKAVICSPLVKTAMFGEDANWGRILCALGYAGAQVDVDKVEVTFKSAAGEVQVCESGRGVDFSEEIAKKVLGEAELTIAIELGDGTATATAWGCDLTYDYVKINGDYRT